ncbi:uncharacterized protein PRCAT00002459001 [Priceomyces carsonii]|uniref:uncharacterized protein n=1 Tax=Priceomyces carsonii TaxID=28549 RepID=UPI002ED94BC0|nr:unnamed protein product [Priceomyces carsonii]
MVAKIYSYSLEDLEKIEDIKLERFDTENAWNLGTEARNLAMSRYPNKSVVIDISLPSGQVLFHTVINSGTALDNDEWVNRKKRTVFRFGRSSFYMGQKLRLKGKSIEDALFISAVDYATHGGSVAIRNEGLDIIVGALTVSGLAQEEDHLLAIDILKEFKARS